jgi:hypothetical protein
MTNYVELGAEAASALIALEKFFSSSEGQAVLAHAKTVLSGTEGLIKEIINDAETVSHPAVAAHVTTPST